MKNFIGQSTSESERSYPVVPDQLFSEKSIPSEKPSTGLRIGEVVYSHEHYASSYILRSLRTRLEH
jgi:hypothetical protein